MTYAFGGRQTLDNDVYEEGAGLLMSCRAQGTSPRAGLLMKPLAKDGDSSSKQLLSNRFRTLKNSGLRGSVQVPA
jgi:hypothetical protein